ncbi:MAG: hypothetical protein Q4G23_00325 [Clostridia bacterium]|nr:hypothetical protein [Clostridia bacterium]
MKELKKKYESPALSITELEVEDVMLVSGFSSLVTAEEILGQGKIQWIEIDLN